MTTENTEIQKPAESFAEKPAETTEEVVVEHSEVKPEETELNPERFRSGSDEEPEEVIAPETTEKKPAEKPSETITATQTEVDDYWGTYKEIIGDSYEIPEVIKTGKKEDGSTVSSKEKFALLANEIAKNVSYSGNPEVDAFVKDVISSAKSSEFNLTDHLGAVSKDILDPSKMDIDDKVFQHYKMEYGQKDENDTTGMTDDAIKTEIESLRDSEKIAAARKFDNDIKGKISTQEIAYKEKHNANIDANFAKLQETETKFIDTYVEKAKLGKSIDGIEFSEEDHAQFVKDAPDFYKKVVKQSDDGYSFVSSEVQEVLKEILGSPEKSMTMMPFLWLYKNKKLAGYSNQLKEAVKENIEGKLAPEPSVTQTQHTGDEFSGKDFRSGRKK